MENEPKNEEKGKEIQPSPFEIDEKTREELSALFRGGEINGEKLPPVYLKLFSGPHGSAEDAEGMKPLLDEADVFVPEAYEWRYSLLHMFRDISRGEKNPQSGCGFSEQVKNYLFGTQKQVVIVDVPEEEAISHPELYPETDDIIGRLKYSSYEEAPENFFEDVAINARVDVINREAYMAKHFAEKIKETILRYPELQKKDTLKILMQLGRSHSAIYHLLKNIGGDHVSRDFRYDMPLASESEMVRRVGFKKEVGRELKERALCEALIEDGLFYLSSRLTDNSAKKEFFLRYLSSQFSGKEMKELFEKRMNYDGDPQDFILSVLEDKNISFPKNEKELDEMLAQTSYGKYQANLKNQEKNGS